MGSTFLQSLPPCALAPNFATPCLITWILVEQFMQNPTLFLASTVFSTAVPPSGYCINIHQNTPYKFNSLIYIYIWCIVLNALFLWKIHFKMHWTLKEYKRWALVNSSTVREAVCALQMANMAELVFFSIKCYREAFILTHWLVTADSYKCIA